MREKARLAPDEEPLFGLLFHDQLLFSTHFWSRELSLPMSTKQKVMYNDVSEKRLNCTGRKTAKTILIEGTVVRESCIHDPEVGYAEAMFFAPGEGHITPVRDRVVSNFLSNPVLKPYLLNYNKNEGTWDTANGLRWFIRVEGLSGSERNMVGPRTILMIGDELAFGNQACETGRKQTALPGCRFMYCGVPNGVRNSPFFDLDQTHLGALWSRHKLISLDNPMYAHKYKGMEKAREKLIKEYGGANTQGYITQALGQWGEEAYSAFPPEAIARRIAPYDFYEFGGEAVKNMVQLEQWEDRIRLPRVDADRYVIGLDYGFAQDPAVIVIAYEVSRYEWQELARIKLYRATAQHQAKLLDAINRILLGGKVVAICTDELSVITAMLNTDEPTSVGNQDDYETKVVWSNPMGTTIVTDDEGKEVLDDQQKPVKMRRKEWMTEELRNSMAYANLALPYPFYLYLCMEDLELAEELAGTTQRKTAAGYTVYEPAKRNEDHNTDALRDIACAILDYQRRGDAGDYDDDLTGYGWAGAREMSMEEGQAWKPPWS